MFIAYVWACVIPQGNGLRAARQSWRERSQQLAWKRETPTEWWSHTTDFLELSGLFPITLHCSACLKCISYAELRMSLHTTRSGDNKCECLCEREWYRKKEWVACVFMWSTQRTSNLSFFLLFCCCLLVNNYFFSKLTLSFSFLGFMINDYPMSIGFI